MSSQIVLRIPRVSIEYCIQCRWLTRAAWVAQELLTTFSTHLGEVAIIPGANAIFQVKLNDEIIFDRKTQGRFPEIKELKQLIRDVIAPGLPLGHSDSKVKSKIDDVALSGSDLKAKAQDEPSEEYEECEECADGSCEQCTKDEFKFDFSQFE